MSFRFGMLGLLLALAACTGQSPEEAAGEAVGNANELRAKVEETAVFTKCELDGATGLPAIEVELANPISEAWDSQSITIGVSVNDPDGFFLADADVVFTNMAVGETATATASAASFPDDGALGDCVLFDVVVSNFFTSAD